jgi:hypothetical protein
MSAPQTGLVLPKGHSSSPLVRNIPGSGVSQLAKRAFRAAELLIPVLTVAELVCRGVTNISSSAQKNLLSLAQKVIQVYFIYKFAYKYLKLGIYELLKGKPVMEHLPLRPGTNEYAVAEAVRKNRLLGNAFFGVIQRLFENKPVVICDNLSALNLAEGIQKASNEGKIVAIPIIEKGFFRDHIMTLIIDPRKKLIYFMDSKGYSLADYAHANIYETSAMRSVVRMKTAWTSIVNSIAIQGWSFIENSHPYQKDAYNCGVHFYHTLNEYLAKREIPQPLETLEQVREERRLIITEIGKLPSY